MMATRKISLLGIEAGKRYTMYTTSPRGCHWTGTLLMNGTNQYVLERDDGSRVYLPRANVVVIVEHHADNTDSDSDSDDGSANPDHVGPW